MPFSLRETTLFRDHWRAKVLLTVYPVQQRRRQFMAEDLGQLKQAVEGGDGIYVIRSSKTHRQWNGIQYKTGLSAKNVPARKLSMNVATIPPGGVAYAHIHVDFDVMLYILQGHVRHEYGAGLKKSVENEARHFIYIEPGVP